MKLSRSIVASLFALGLAGMNTSAWAGQSTGEGIAMKAARGVENTVFGLVAEWPKTIYYQSRKHGLPHGMTVGLLQGFGVGVARTSVGLYELATFPIPVPAEYRPILSPQFSLEPEETRIAQ